MKLAFVYVTDERGFGLAAHSAMSLALSQPKPCNIHIFCYAFLPAQAQQISADLAKRQIALTFETIGDAVLERHRTCGHVTTPSLLKLLAIEQVIDRYDRVAFLDNDMLVFEDLRIIGMVFGQAPIAAVIDMDLSATGALRHSAWSADGGGTLDSGAYFNSGFMVFEARNWRGQAFYEEYAAALDAHDVRCPYKLDCTSIEQCALNKVFEGDWLELPPSYNMQASAKFTKAWQTASVRHYCGRRKFIPISTFRNDGRDVRYINAIRTAIGQRATHGAHLYEILFRLNAVRCSRSALAMQRFLSAVQVRNAAPRVRAPPDLRDPD